MDIVVIPLIVVMTTAVSCAFMRSRLSRVSVKAAVAKYFEFCGIFVLFLALNTVFVLGVGLAMRALALPFLSLYVVGDPMLIVFSLIQALFFYFLGGSH